MKRKRLITIILIDLVLLIVIYCIISTYQNYKNSKINFKEIPVFNLKDVNGDSFSNMNFNQYDLKVVFQYYDTDCSECQLQAQDLYQNRQALKDVKYVLISSNNLKDIKKFAVTYKLNSIKNNIFFLQDSLGILKKELGVFTTPSFYLYKGNRLKASTTGLINTKTLLKKFN